MAVSSKCLNDNLPMFAKKVIANNVILTYLLCCPDCCTGDGVNYNEQCSESVLFCS